MFWQVHLKIPDVRFWHWNHFGSASILLVILANFIQNHDFHVQRVIFRRMMQPFFSTAEFFIVFKTLNYYINDMVAGWFWQEQFWTGFNDTISIFGSFFETTRQFHWNHVVFSGFIETISSKKVVLDVKFGRKWLKARFQLFF